jgi:hypothetical protein
MHELAHNLGLRHSGDTITYDFDIDTEYGDSSGYMGESTITAWTPLKCYNAAQHWQLGWFGSDGNGQGVSFRLSLSDTVTDAPSLPLRINAAAFVDYMKLVSSLNTGTYDESFVVLVQVTSNIYLQYNGAKSYNIGTDTEYANQVVVIEQDTTDLSTTVLASLVSDESYVIPNTNRMIYICDIIVSSTTDTSSDTVIDFATIAISDTHTSSTILSVCQNGPEYVNIPSQVSLPVTTTVSPTDAPTANTIVASTEVPTISPLPPMSPAPTVSTNDAVEETLAPTTATPVISNDSNGTTDDRVNDVTEPPSIAPTVVVNANDPDDMDEDMDENLTPTMMPIQNFNLRGSDNDTVDTPNGKNTSATSNESSADNGLSTSSIIYSVFGTVLGALIISIVVLFYLSRYSKATTTTYERQNANSRRRGPSSRPKSVASSSSSRSKKQKQDAYAVNGGSSRTMKSPDGSPTIRRSDRDHEDRSKSTAPSATTRSSSQLTKPKLVLEQQRPPVVATTCFYKNKHNDKDQQRNDRNDNEEEDDDSSDDDKSDTLSVILQKEIWKDRVHRILQSVFLVQDKDGTVTQMLPAAAIARHTETESPGTTVPPGFGSK